MSSRPRSSGGYGRPKSNSQSSDATDNNGNRAKSTDKPRRQIVGQYMIGKTIGEGTFGKVKLAVHIPTGEKVAIKILEKNRIKEQADVRRVNREIKILKKARHGNIIQLYEVLDTKNTIYLIMECCEGGEMFDYIVAQKRVEEQQACKFFHQIIDGIDVLHKNEITHRDLKPENLLLKATNDGWVVKIVDFGLSNTHEGGKLLATACGSPCYAAPEMIAGKKYYGPGADIWSLGVILFALVSGYLPFEDSNTSILYKKILSGDYSTPKWISPEVKDLIHCILEVDPRKRYTIENIRRHVWYNMVPDSAIPRDILYSTEASRAEILTMMAKTGLDTQAVLDGVASQAYNNLTAMYYLLEQKQHTRLMKKASSSKAQIRQNSSNLSKPETGSEQNDHSTTTTTTAPTTKSAVVVSTRKENVQGNSSNNGGKAHNTVTSTTGNTTISHTHTGSSTTTSGNKTAAPVRLMNIDPLTPIIHHPSQQHTDSKTKDYSHNIPIKTYVPATTTPYLQTPTILQQHSQQAVSRPQHHNMPSLDMYLRGGMDLPIGGATASGNNSNGNNSKINSANNSVIDNKNNATSGTGSSSKPTSTTAVPPLNLRFKSSNNTTSVAVAAATGNSSLFAPKIALTSQTARGPNNNNNLLPGSSSNDTTASGRNQAASAVPQSARAPVPTDIIMDIPERPNTRRSRQRSRGGDSSQQAPLEADPAVGLAGVEAMPPTKETSPRMPVRRPEPPPRAPSGGPHRPQPGASGGGHAHGGTSEAVAGSLQEATEAMSLLVISQKKNLSPKGTENPSINSRSNPPTGEINVPTTTANSGSNTSNGARVVGVVPKAPEAPKTSASTNSGVAGAPGGRRGRNITSSTASVTSTTAVVATIPSNSEMNNQVDLNKVTIDTSNTHVVVNLSSNTNNNNNSLSNSDSDPSKLPSNTVVVIN